MSRAYRISVRESSSRVIKADDAVSTQLEVLEVLPREQMSELIADALKGQGFEDNGETLTRQEKNGVVVEVDPCTGTVTVRASASEEVEVEGTREGRSYDDVGPNSKAVRETLRKELQKDLEKQIGDKEGKLQTKVTDKLESQLGDLRQELDQVVNKVTAEALKRKAAQLGTIKEVSEDQQSGSLTIVLEV